MNFKYISILLSSISCINCAVHFERIYGVADKDLGKYQKTPDNLFHCLDGNGVIPYSSLNDDYCDCPDGSDEPGTPACQNSKFYCENRGGKPNYIPSSRVNDGVCDYDLCCDGSDEYNGIIICPDKCKEMSKQELKEKKEKLINYFKSYQKHQILMFESLSAIKVDALKLAAKKESYEKENIKLTEIKDKIKHLEEIEKESKDFYRQLYRELRTEYNFNHNLLKVAYRDLLTLKNYKNMSETEIESILNYYDEDHFREAILTKNGVVESVEVEVDAEDYDEDKKDEEEEKRLVEEKRKIYNELRSDLTDLRVQRNDLDRAVRNYKREADEIEKKLKIDSGKNKIFYSLYDETYKLNTTDYIYTFTWGKEIKQKQKKGGSLTLLGKFKEYRDDYKTIFYDEGAKCWDGPKRSVKIDLVCDSENQIIKIEEPSKCEYVMKFASPGACDPAELNELAGDHKKITKSEGGEEDEEFSKEMLDSIQAMINESPTQSILDEDEVLGKVNTEGGEEVVMDEEKVVEEDQQKHDEL